MRFNHSIFDAAPCYHRGAFPILMIALVLSAAALLFSFGTGCTTVKGPDGTVVRSVDVAGVNAFVTAAQTAAQTGIDIYTALQNGNLRDAQTEVPAHRVNLDALEAALNAATVLLPADAQQRARDVIADGLAIIDALGQKSVSVRGPDLADSIARANALKTAVAGLSQ